MTDFAKAIPSAVDIVRREQCYKGFYKLEPVVADDPDAFAARVEQLVGDLGDERVAQRDPGAEGGAALAPERGQALREEPQGHRVRPAEGHDADASRRPRPPSTG